jgi:hypothetical protein
MFRRHEFDSILTPLAPVSALAGARWVDLYDDWSIAPDISPLGHIASRITYYQVMRASEPQHILTVNSRYMQDKFWKRDPHLILNGVDEAISSYPLGQDDRPKLVILGALFKGRVDFGLLQRLLGISHFAEVLVADAGRVGKDLRTQLRASGSTRITVVDRMSWPELASWAGPRTVAAIPHVVSDYTISQDSMKLYQYLGLGLPIMIPRALWPSHLPIERGLLIEQGVDLTSLAKEATRLGTATPDWRRRFVDNHSWRRRALEIAELLAQ